MAKHFLPPPHTRTGTPVTTFTLYLAQPRIFPNLNQNLPVRKEGESLQQICLHMKKILNYVTNLPVVSGKHQVVSGKHQVGSSERRARLFL